MKRSVLMLSIFLTSVSGCSDPFSYSPFEVSVEERFEDTTEKNLRRIIRADTIEDVLFKVAFLSDSHYHFEKLAKAIEDINSRADVSFIFVVGDITENGLQKEFELFHRIMQKSRVPYLTVIGNHDYLSNGARVYHRLFGSLNYSFTYRSVKFIVWDNVFWESRKSPDFDWLAEQLRSGSTKGSDATNSLNHMIPIAHIPPSDQQFQSSKARYHDLLRESSVQLSVHGHKHRYSRMNLFADEIEFLTVGSPQHREYSILTFDQGTITIERIVY